MTAGIHEVEAGGRQHIPILHFGMISLDSRMGFVLGGYSRVYFGKFRNALKIIYAMELTTDDVKYFFYEANLCTRCSIRTSSSAWGSA